MFYHSKKKVQNPDSSPQQTPPSEEKPENNPPKLQTLKLFLQSNQSTPTNEKERFLFVANFFQKFFQRLPIPSALKKEIKDTPPEDCPNHQLPKLPLASSLQVKFALSSLSILMAVLVLMNIYPISATQKLLWQSKDSALLSQISMISSLLVELEQLGSSSVHRLMSTIDSSAYSRIIITDPYGEILYDSTNQNTTQGTYALTQEIYLALLGNDVRNATFYDDNIQSTAAAPIIYGDNTIGAIYLQEDDFVQGRLLSSLRDNLRTLSWVSAFIGSLLYAIFSLFLTNRIRAMLAAIRIVGEGDYGHRLLPRGNDEMAYLAMEFNILTDRLQTTEEVRRRFVSDASHELRTPLASIKLLADSILHNETIDPAMTREFVADICTESERLSRITERLLTLSKLDSLPAPTAEPVSTQTVLERILQNLELSAEEQEITLKYQGQAHYVLCSPDKLHQICYNIIENAVKYTPKGGIVEISTTVTEQEIHIRISDNGLGIPPEDLPKIFNRFYRVDDARSREAGGTGLGLAIVRDTLRAYGGWVEAQNNIPKGTTFLVGLPKTNPTMETPPQTQGKTS